MSPLPRDHHTSFSNLSLRIRAIKQPKGRFEYYGDRLRCQWTNEYDAIICVLFKNKPHLKIFLRGIDGKEQHGKPNGLAHLYRAKSQPERDKISGLEPTNWEQLKVGARLYHSENMTNEQVGQTQAAQTSTRWGYFLEIVEGDMQILRTLGAGPNALIEIYYRVEYFVTSEFVPHFIRITDGFLFDEEFDGDIGYTTIRTSFRCRYNDSDAESKASDCEADGPDANENDEHADPAIARDKNLVNTNDPGGLDLALSKMKI
ncbi:hypothetical protein TWF694_004535 [Orbilia ellipsospora]|uniref:Uncharacterized protein n=1 Tax=Orbilia ellipsospora TaxID=2528407 RepID=A0AAV9WWI4_9PEZI